MTDHILNFHSGQAVVEGEGDGAVGDAFGDGEVAAFEAVVLHVEGLEVDGGEIVGAADVMGAEVIQNGVAVRGFEVACQADDEDEPAHDGVVVGCWEDEVGFVEEVADVLVGDALAGVDDFGEALHLDDADGGVEVAEAVIVAEAGVGEPTATRVAALVAEGAAHVGEFFVVGDDHAAFAGGDLFIGVEAEDADAAEGADLAAFVGTAEAFAGVFDEGDFVAGGDGGDFVHADGVAEGFDGEDGFGFGGDGGFDFVGIEVEGLGVDVDEDGSGADHLDDVGGGDEGEGGGDDLVAGADVQGEEAAVEAGGAGGDGDGFVDVEVVLEGVFELGAFGAQGEMAGFQNVDDGLDFGVGDVGAG